MNMVGFRCVLAVAALAWGALMPPWAEAGEKAGPVTGSREREGFTYYQAGRRDPFGPLKTGSRECRQMGLTSMEQIKLTGIVWDARQYLALIELPNGQGYAVRTSDVICENTRVTKIGPDGLTLEADAGTEPPREKKESRQITIPLRRD